MGAGRPLQPFHRNRFQGWAILDRLWLHTNLHANEGVSSCAFLERCLVVTGERARRHREMTPAFVQDDRIQLISQR